MRLALLRPDQISLLGAQGTDDLWYLICYPDLRSKHLCGRSLPSISTCLMVPAVRIERTTFRLQGACGYISGNPRTSGNRPAGRASARFGVLDCPTVFIQNGIQNGTQRPKVVPKMVPGKKAVGRYAESGSHEKRRGDDARNTMD